MAEKAELTWQVNLCWKTPKQRDTAGVGGGRGGQVHGSTGGPPIHHTQFKLGR